MNSTKEFYENGKLKATGLLQEGKKNGKWLYFTETGDKFREIEYLDGVENGEWKMWHENGNLYIEQYKINGKSKGLWKEYYENGKPKEIGEYKDDGYFPIDFWDENANHLLKDGTGKKIEKFGALEADIYEHYFKDGKLIKEVKIS